MQKDKVICFAEVIAKWCVFLLIFSLPFSKSIVEICIAAGILSIGAKKILTKEKLFADVPARIPLLLFVTAAGLSLINSGYFLLSARALVSKCVKFVLLYFVVVEAINTREKLKDLLIIAFLSMCIITVDGFIQYYVLHIDLLHFYPAFKYRGPQQMDPFIGFPTASFPYPNDLAAWLLIFLLPGLSLIVFDRAAWKERLMAALLFAPPFYLFVLTKARGAYMGFIAALVCLFVVNIKRALAAGLALFIIIASIFVINNILPSDTRGNQSLMGDILSFKSVSDRMVMWRNGWKIFMRHPVIGNGINTFFRHYAEVRDDQFKNSKGSYAHNCYLQMAADIGIVGLGAFLLFIATLFFSSLARIGRMRSLRHALLATGLLAGIFAFLVHSFFDTNLYSLNLAALFWFAAGLETAIVRIASRQ